MLSQINKILLKMDIIRLDKLCIKIILIIRLIQTKRRLDANPSKQLVKQSHQPKHSKPSKFWCKDETSDYFKSAAIMSSTTFMPTSSLRLESVRSSPTTR